MNMKNNRRQVGIVGGTFDPFHYAHLQMGLAAQREFGLDEVLFMPTGDPPHKSNKVITPGKQRFEMVQLALEDLPNLYVSDIELKREGTIYTADTLTQLTTEHPDTDYFYIVGADSLDYMAYWYKPDVICRLCTILAVRRSSQSEERVRAVALQLKQVFGARVFILDCSEMNISSTEIRRCVQEGESIEPFVGKKVANYIREHHLYTGGVMDINIKELKKSLKKTLDDSRYEHTIGVSYTAVCMAMKFGVSLKKAEIAGLLHDCAKCISDSSKIEQCHKAGIAISDAEMQNPSLLHAKLGAYLVNQKYGVTDVDIIGAVRWHTTGKANMTLLQKIIFTADYIEPNRNKAPHLAEIRKKSFEDLDLAVYMILRDTIDYVRERGLAMDTTTLQA
ncbi:MAG: nicotinate-nucleotide adenylyltransferase, partial [Lachnospiraceae bacterium]